MRLVVVVAALNLACNATNFSAATATDTSGYGDDGNPGDEGTFIPMGDVEPPQCDPFAQDCAAGEKCVPYVSGDGTTWDANRCVAVTGDGIAGAACTTQGLADPSDSCDADHLCWELVHVDGALNGTCRPFCTGDAETPVCADDALCQIDNAGSVNVCVGRCDPLEQSCGDSLGCHITGGEDFFCQPTSGGYVEGEACVYANDCYPGLFCAAGATVPDCTDGGCCTPYCDLTESPTSCASGTECIAFFDPSPAHYIDVGVCLTPTGGA